MSRYLRSVRPLLDDESFEKAQKDAREFQNGIGKKLQRYVVMKSWWSSNYVSDWWEEFGYHRSRTPLMVASNIYGSDCLTVNTTSQAARAGNMTYLIFQFGRSIENQELQPLMLQGIVPLCSWQYERMFNTTRIPGLETDKIVHYEESNHIIVLHKGCYYKVIISENGRDYNPCELQLQYEHILSQNEKATRAENNLAALTAWDRTKWAQVREEYLMSGINKLSLFEIERAALFISLDEEPYVYSLQSSPTEYGHYVRQIFHGKGNNLWFDKSLNLLISANGRVSVLNIEEQIKFLTFSKLSRA